MKKMNGMLMMLTMLSAVAFGQQPLTEHTFSLPKEAPLGKGQLSDVSWLVGSWQGTAFGSQFEEVWNPGSVGSMVGMWKLFDAVKGVHFYELMLLKEQGDGLVLKVKHFSADFVAWEDKEDAVTFRLIKVEKDAVHFSGLSFYKKSEDDIEGYIVMSQKDGKKVEHKISYKRTK